jgi:hypothetical protein
MKTWSLVLALIVVWCSVSAAHTKVEQADQTNLVYATPGSFGQVAMRVRSREHDGRRKTSGDVTSQTSYGELDITLENLTPATTYVLRVQYSCHVKQVSNFGRDRKSTMEVSTGTSSVTNNNSKRLEHSINSASYTSTDVRIINGPRQETKITLLGWDVTVWLNDRVVMQAVCKEKAKFHGIKGSDSL